MFQLGRGHLDHDLLHAIGTVVAKKRRQWVQLFSIRYNTHTYAKAHFFNLLYF
jgi:hypothetical protein